MLKKSEYYSIQFVSILFYLIPLALLTGPFLPDLFLSIITIYFILIATTKRLKKYFFNGFFYFFIIFYFYLILSSLMSDFVLFSLKSSFFYLRFGIFALATWYLIENNKYFIKYFTYIFLLTFLFALIDGYFQIFYVENIFGFSSFNSNRLNLTLSDRMLLGNYLSRMLPLLIALLIINLSSKKISYLLFGSLLVFSDVLIYMTGERTALGLIFIMTVFVILFMTKFRLLRILSFALSIIAILFLTFTNSAIKERNVDLTISQLGLDEKSPKVNYFSPAHESHFTSAMKIFIDRPLLGAGPNNFRNLCSYEEFYQDTFSCSTHPHNTYIQLISELGIFGFLIFLLLVIYFIKIILLHTKTLILFQPKFTNDYQICLISCFVLTLFPFLPTLNFFNNWINVIYYLPVGFYLHSIYQQSLK